RVAGEEPRTPERAIVCRGLEYRDCLARDSQELLRPNRGARRQLMRDELDASAVLHASIARSERRLERPAKDLSGSVKFAPGAKRQSELAQKLALPLAARQQGGCPVEQIHGRRHVSPLPGANSGASEPVAGFGREQARRLVDRRELRLQSKRLFQVVSHQLVLPGHALREPLSERSVQRASPRLGSSAVRNVPDQDMAEREGLLAQERSAQRSDELPADEARKVAVDRSRRATRHEVAN